MVRDGLQVLCGFAAWAVAWLGLAAWLLGSGLVWLGCGLAWAVAAWLGCCIPAIMVPRVELEHGRLPRHRIL